MSQGREAKINECLTRAINQVLEQLPYTEQVLNNPLYDLNKTVENKLDFLLGAIFAQIIDRFAIFCLTENIKATNEECAKLNYYLFSRAGEFKQLITKLLGV